MSKFIPKLYYYEHCPYCIRVLVIAGLTDTKIDKEVLLNDDDVLPSKMIGKKMVPILEKMPKKYMGESLDIIDYICKISNYKIKNNSDTMELVNNFLSENRISLYSLIMPRWPKIGLKEFSTASAVSYFTKKKTESIGDFDIAISNTDILSKQLVKSLEKNEGLFKSLLDEPNSYSAIILFSALHGLSSVKGFIWTDSSSSFMKKISDLSAVDLFDKVAV